MDEARLSSLTLVCVERNRRRQICLCEVEEENILKRGRDIDKVQIISLKRMHSECWIHLLFNSKFTTCWRLISLHLNGQWCRRLCFNKLCTDLKRNEYFYVLLFLFSVNGWQGTRPVCVQYDRRCTATGWLTAQWDMVQKLRCDLHVPCVKTRFLFFF